METATKTGKLIQRIRLKSAMERSMDGPTHLQELQLVEVYLLALYLQLHLVNYFVQ